MTSYRAPTVVPDSDLLVVIPAYNEAANIAATVADVRMSLPDFDVLVVDDGSADATAARARGAGARVLRLPVNSGYGVALQTGYKYAVRHGYRTVAQMDADGQHHAEYMPELLALVDDGTADIVIGSRFLDGDGHYQPSRARKIGMSIFSRMASRIMRQHVSDPTSGYQVMRIDVARFFCTDVYPADYPDADILILLHRSGFRVAEVGVQMRMPTGKSMHSGHRSLYYVYKMFLSILVTMLRPSAEGPVR
ncbi:glycosyltransferase family 2 protein [Baekduia soli]|uniref:Glycosyltransferase family 2 protein n=1 Tax=Baekduia soli TaxID=496014 RepID=A0A5B8TZU5_9ACTN|nr:glycosyltransferase family 2 protein [Baekduia soli]QEC46249.1 glycosyltransferase family 2 protein [Baekduia soli]